MTRLREILAAMARSQRRRFDEIRRRARARLSERRAARKDRDRGRVAVIEEMEERPAPRRPRPVRQDIVASAEQIAPSSSRVRTPPRRRVDASTRALFLVGLLVMASGSAALRPQLGSFALHPYLLILAPLVALSGLRRVVSRVPPRVAVAFIGLLVVHTAAAVQSSNAWAEFVKLGTFGGSILAVSGLVRSWIDVRAVVFGAAFGLLAAVVPALIRGVEVGELFTFDSGGRNGFSLYALPVLLAGGFLCLGDRRLRHSPLLLLPLLIAGIVGLVAIAASGNRSGWLGAVLIGAMLLVRGRSFGATMGILLVACVAWYSVAESSAIDIVRLRIDQVQAGQTNDELREELLGESVRIGLENPFLGVGAGAVGSTLAERLRNPEPEIDAHNTFGYLIAASGIPGLLAAGLFLGSLAWPYGLRRRPRWEGPFGPASLVRMMVILAVVRGLFTSEMLHSPTFAIMIGVALAIARPGFIPEPLQSPRVQPGIAIASPGRSR